MTIQINSNVSPSAELKAMRKQASRNMAVSSLVSVSTMVAGVALIVFLSANWLTFGIALVIAAAFTFCYHYNQYTFLNDLYKKVSAAVDERIAQIRALQ